MAPIPAPAERPKLDDYPRDERARYYQDLDAWWAATEGLELVGRVGEPLDGIIDPQDQFDLLQFCSECCAGGSPFGEPVRGLDSHRDCVSDGGTVWWARPTGQSAEPAEPDDEPAGTGTEPEPKAEPETNGSWPPHRWVRLPKAALEQLAARETDLREMQSLLRRSRDSEIDRYFSRLIGGQLAAVDAALEIVASLEEQSADVERCTGWSHNSTIHIEMCGNCSQPHRDHPSPEPPAPEPAARLCPGSGRPATASHSTGLRPECPICGRTFSRALRSSTLPEHEPGRQVRSAT